MAILFLLLFGPEKLPTVIVEGMKLFRQLRSAAEEATGEIRREFEAAASEIEAATKELTSAVDEVQRFGVETRALVDEAQREAVTGEAAGGAARSAEADDSGAPSDIGSILPPDMAEMMRVHDHDIANDIDPADHAIEAMAGRGSGVGRDVGAQGGAGDGDDAEGVDDVRAEDGSEGGEG